MFIYKSTIHIFCEFYLHVNKFCLYLLHNNTRKYTKTINMQGVTSEMGVFTGSVAQPTERLLAMPVTKEAGICIDPEAENLGSYKSAIARLNKETDMWFTQKTIAGKLYIRRVA